MYGKERKGGVKEEKGAGAHGEVQAGGEAGLGAHLQGEGDVVGGVVKPQQDVQETQRLQPVIHRRSATRLLGQDVRHVVAYLSRPTTHVMRLLPLLHPLACMSFVPVKRASVEASYQTRTFKSLPIELASRGTVRYRVQHTHTYTHFYIHTR